MKYIMTLIILSGAAAWGRPIHGPRGSSGGWDDLVAEEPNDVGKQWADTEYAFKLKEIEAVSSKEAVEYNQKAEEARTRAQGEAKRGKIGQALRSSQEASANQQLSDTLKDISEKAAADGLANSGL